MSRTTSTTTFRTSFLLITLLAFISPVQAEEDGLRSCQRLHDKIERYKYLLENGGTASERQMWKQARKNYEKQFRKGGCKKYAKEFEK